MRDVTRRRPVSASAINLAAPVYSGVCFALSYILASLVPAVREAEETIKRGLRYAGAGADGLFVPGAFKNEEIRVIAESVTLPINVMAWPGLPDAAGLAKLGVRRLSSGSAIPQLAWATAERAARGFLLDGDSDPLMEGTKQFGEIQKLFL